MVTSENNIIRNNNSIAKLLEGDIFYIHYLPNTYSEISDIKETFEAYKVLGNSLPLKVLVLFDEYASASREAREYGQNNKLPAIAEAVILHSLPQRILFNFYLKFRKQNHPIKLFTNKENALTWLQNID